MLGVYNMSRNTHPMDQIFPWLDRAKMCRQGSASCVSTKGWHCDSVTLCHYCFSHFSPVLINCYPFLAKAVGLRPWSLLVIVCVCVCVPDSLFWGSSTPMLKDWRKHGGVCFLYCIDIPAGTWCTCSYKISRPMMRAEGDHGIMDDVPHSCQPSLPKGHPALVDGM